jgi:hypothetical protein
MTLTEYATIWSRNPGNNFAVACAEQNTRVELEEALQGPADETDMLTWDMTDPQEWRDAITAVLTQTRHNDEE